MPTYEYQCSSCAHRFDEFQSFSEATLKKCPKCKKNKLARLIGTGAAILFKGSGFYETDYRPDSYNKAAKADNPSHTESSNKETSKAPETGKEGSATAPAKEPTPAPKSTPSKKSKD